MTTTHQTLLIRDLGIQQYEPVWHAMQNFTAQRSDETPDELWCLQHPAVFTMGLNGKQEHLLDTGDIPVVNIDRGGQVTFHGPGQLVIYTLLDLTRLKIGVKELVIAMEQAIINLLADMGIPAEGKRDAPGVYVNQAKIAALGLRIKKGRSYHGLSLNIDMDLSPFERINPCGYKGLPVTQLSNLISNVDYYSIKTQLIEHLASILGYNNRHFSEQGMP